MMTIEVYAYIARGIAGAPPDQFGLHVTQTRGDVQRPPSAWSQQVYWALSMSAPGYPSVLVHVHFEGGHLPPDQQRDEISRATQALVGELLFNRDRGLAD